MKRMECRDAASLDRAGRHELTSETTNFLVEMMKQSAGDRWDEGFEGKVRNYLGINLHDPRYFANTCWYFKNRSIGNNIGGLLGIEGIVRDKKIKGVIDGMHRKTGNDGLSSIVMMAEMLENERDPRMVLLENYLGKDVLGDNLYILDSYNGDSRKKSEERGIMVEAMRDLGMVSVYLGDGDREKLMDFYENMANELGQGKPVFTREYLELIMRLDHDQYMISDAVLKKAEEQAMEIPVGELRGGDIGDYVLEGTCENIDRVTLVKSGTKIQGRLDIEPDLTTTFVATQAETVLDESDLGWVRCHFQKSGEIGNQMVINYIERKVVVDGMCLYCVKDTDNDEEECYVWSANDDKYDPQSERLRAAVHFDTKEMKVMGKRFFQRSGLDSLDKGWLPM